MSFLKSVIISFLCLFSFVCNAFAADPYSKRMADAQMARSGAITSWDYPNGLFVESILKVYNQYGGSAYYNYALNHAKATVNATSGKIAAGYSFNAYTLDNINPGQFLMQIYATENASQYKTALDTLRKQLQKQPRTNYSAAGGFWHKNSYPHQMWLDGLYMGTRFYANYEKTFNNGAAYDDIVNQFVLIHSKTYDPAYQLNYHAWSALPTDANSFWANQSAPFQGCSKEFWGRGMGWYAAALVDVLEILPANYARRQELVDILNQVAAGIKRWQDPASGCWYQLLRYNNTLVSNGTANYLEASASSMFTYALLKAVRLGVISKADYQATATKAYQGLITNFITADTNGALSLNKICRSAGLGPSSSPSRDGTINYYLNGSDAGQVVSNDLKGVGPFILASVEYEMYQRTLTRNTDIQLNTAKFEVVNQNDSIIIQSVGHQLSDVVLYNSNGQEMNRWSGHDLAEITMPVGHYKQGVYLLLINGETVKKIMI
ncbi:MAG TPA: glycoside hydrolase family 88 protein [Paludibacter sp.]|nr:glycoside hydrolase family 88 protein [Paludibacter sp.]